MVCHAHLSQEVLEPPLGHDYDHAWGWVPAGRGRAPQNGELGSGMRPLNTLLISASILVSGCSQPGAALPRERTLPPPAISEQRASRVLGADAKRATLSAGLGLAIASGDGGEASGKADTEKARIEAFLRRHSITVWGYALRSRRYHIL